MNEYYTIYNELEDLVYGGIFHDRREAVMWYHKNDGRPSSYVIKISIPQISQV
jgi:hypothetical protein